MHSYTNVRKYLTLLRRADTSDTFEESWHCCHFWGEESGTCLAGERVGAGAATISAALRELQVWGWDTIFIFGSFATDFLPDVQKCESWNTWKWTRAKKHTAHCNGKQTLNDKVDALFRCHTIFWHILLLLRDAPFLNIFFSFFGKMVKIKVKFGHFSQRFMQYFVVLFCGIH